MPFGELESSYYNIPMLPRQSTLTYEPSIRLACLRKYVFKLDEYFFKISLEDFHREAIAVFAAKSTMPENLVFSNYTFPIGRKTDNF